MTLRILLVEDDPDIRDSVFEALEEAGHTVMALSDGAAAVEQLSSSVFDVVVTDVRLPKVDGHTVFRHARAVSPRTDVILMTSFAEVVDAVTCLQEGARDYLTKPFALQELVVRVGSLAARRSLERELEEARAALLGAASGTIVGASPSMVGLLDRLATVAASDAPVLITGETGTGKELVAKRLHAASTRAQKPFVAVNCAAFPEGLLDAELFGHERGAFTGAVKRRDGRFKSAEGGTLLLDEVAEMPLAAQAKLLRVLQEGVIEPLGTNTAVRVDVRIVSATHRDLRRRIADGLFREDLYYRLNGVALHVPPLRERPSDLPLLAAHFLRLFGPPGGPVPTISLPAWQALATYPFLGNVREFAHAIRHAVLLSKGQEILLQHLPGDVIHVAEAAPSDRRSVRPLAAVLKQAEREHLLKTLAITGGHRTQAAELLGISRKTLWEKLRVHDLSESDVDDPSS